MLLSVEGWHRALKRHMISLSKVEFEVIEDNGNTCKTKDTGRMFRVVSSCSAHKLTAGSH